MLERLKNGTIAWAKKPYSDDNNVIGWFLFFGMVICIGWLWSQVIKRIA